MKMFCIITLIFDKIIRYIEYFGQDGQITKSSNYFKYETSQFSLGQIANFLLKSESCDNFIWYHLKAMINSFPIDTIIMSIL